MGNLQLAMSMEKKQLAFVIKALPLILATLVLVVLVSVSLLIDRLFSLKSFDKLKLRIPNL